MPGSRAVCGFVYNHFYFLTADRIYLAHVCGKEGAKQRRRGDACNAKHDKFLAFSLIETEGVFRVPFYIKNGADRFINNFINNIEGGKT